MLLHGMLAGAAHWQPLMDEMGDEVEFVAVDLPGYGASRWQNGEEYTLDAVVARLAPVVEAEEPDFIVGHSMGAIVALAIARHFPGKFAGVGVIGLPVYANWHEDPTVLAVDRISRRLRFYNNPRAHIACRLFSGTARAWIPLAPLMRGARPAAVLRAYFDHSQDAHYGSLREVVFAGRVPGLADDIQTPVAALHGERDRAAAIATVRDLAGEHGWRFRTVYNGGHQTVLYRPNLVARWLREDLLALG